MPAQLSGRVQTSSPSTKLTELASSVRTRCGSKISSQNRATVVFPIQLSMLVLYWKVGDFDSSLGIDCFLSFFFFFFFLSLFSVFARAGLLEGFR